MKKYLIVFAALAMVFAGCNQPAGNQYTKISFKNDQVYLAVGGSENLNVLYEPTTLDAPKCEWSSSNEQVVTVDQNGKITGVALGEANVTAKLGELSAACKVAVVDPLDLVSWGGWSLWGLNKETILSTDTVKRTLRSGQEVSCVMIPATYKIWSDGIYMDDEGYLNGAGYVIDVEGTALLITDDLGKGPNYHYLGVSRLDLVDANSFVWTDTTFANCAMAGALGDPAKHYEWLNDTTGATPQQFTAKIAAIDYDAGKYIDPFSGLAGTGVFVGDETTALYKFNAGWFNEPQMYGLKALEDYSGFVQPYAWAPITAKYYEYLGEESAPVYMVKEYVAPKEQKIARPDVLTHK